MRKFIRATFLSIPLAFALSFLLHLVFFTTFLIILKPKHKNSKKNQPYHVETYLYKESQHMPKKTISYKKEKENIRENSLSLSPPKNTFSTNNSSSPKKPSKRNPNKNQTLSPSNTSNLKLLLYQLIQSRIQYPAAFPKSTRENGERKIYVQFSLFPDGQIKSIKILKSSGHHLLDKTVISAISDISFISIPKGLLKQETKFTIDFVFL